MARAGTSKDQGAAFLSRPVRRCASCRERKSAADMLRFMRGGGNWLWQPSAGHISGRSLYLCPGVKCLNVYRSRLTDGESLTDFLAQLETTIAAYVEKRRLELRNDNPSGTSKAASRLASTVKTLAALKRELSMTR